MDAIEPQEESKRYLLNRKIASLTFIVAGLGLAVMLFSTTPTEVGPVGVTGFFLLLYLFSFSVLEIIYRLTVGKNKYWPYWLKATYALAPVAVIALSSLRQLTTVDIFMGIVLLVAISVYHNRNS